MFNRVLIIDDFYKNPEEIVDVALTSPIEEAAPYGHAQGMLTTRFFLGESLRELFQKLTLEASALTSAEANGKILFSQHNTPSSPRVYSDPGLKSIWTGVIYLSKHDEPEVDGTCFWRHLPTGLETGPTTYQDLQKHGWSSPQDFNAWMDSEGSDPTLWEKTWSVPYRFNRLVLFRPWQFHSHGPAFGDSLASSRKVQTLYFASQPPTADR